MKGSLVLLFLSLLNETFMGDDDTHHIPFLAIPATFFALRNPAFGNMVLFVVRVQLFTSYKLLPVLSIIFVHYDRSAISELINDSRLVGVVSRMFW